MAETFETMKTRLGDWMQVDTTRLPDAVRGYVINQVQKRIQRKHDLRFGEIVDTLAVTANDRDYDLPDLWRTPLSLWYINPETDARVDVGRLPKDLFDARYADTTETGTVANYTVWGNVLFLGPTPEVSFTLNRNYYAFLADLADGSPNNTNEFIRKADDVLFFGSLEWITKYLIEDARAPTWAAISQELETDLVSEHQREKSAGRAVQSVEPG